MRQHGSGGPTPAASGYAHLQRLVAEDRCVILDGGTATELPHTAIVHGAAEPTSARGQRARGGERDRDQGGLAERLWGMTALVDAPEQVLRVHRDYVAAGCDVISTGTWGLPTAVLGGSSGVWDRTGPVHWVDVARRGVRLARQAIGEADRTGSCAVAFSLNSDIDTEEGRDTVRLLTRAFEADPPDLVLLETLALVRTSTYSTIESFIDAGIPLWLSFRRCVHGVCGVYGEHWGGPEGDRFGRAARRFEDMGVGALLINCLPPDHVPGMAAWLRDFTDLPLGVYPNLGYYTNEGWRSETEVGPRDYAAMALRWRDEGAQIIGGCCGVGPAQIAAIGPALSGTKAGRKHLEEVVDPEMLDAEVHGQTRAAPARPGWQDSQGRGLFPLPFPDIRCEPGVFVPTQGSFLVWRHLFQHGIGAGARCLDIGCGTGVLATQLALNGAAHVHAIDNERRAVDNTLTNAFRNGVVDRVTAATVDLWPWIPEERYDVIVASLYQMPVDPLEHATSHRPADYWGRNLLDHLIAKLPAALAPHGRAYVMQLSILSGSRTAELLEERGLQSRVVDFAFFPFHGPFEESREQIRRVEEISDAYHMAFDGHDVMVAYLLEVTRTGAGPADHPDS